MENKIKHLKLMKHALEALCILHKINKIKVMPVIKVKRKRSCSVRATNRDRRKNGFFVLTFLRLKEVDHKQFFIYTRMTPQVFELLLNLIKPFLQKESLRQPVQPECRLAVTLLYLTQGNSFQSLAESFKLGKETVRCIILETTEVIWGELSSIYVAETNEEGYKQIAQDFWNMWDIPNCIGSIDGKHIALQCPNNSGSKIFDHKKLSSIVLLAACDARYRFTHIDIGAYGSQRDGGIFQLSRFGKRLLNNKLPIPAPRNLPNTDLNIPHFFVGNAAFPLGKNLMRPFPGEFLSNDKEVFNKRLSRASHTIENAFGILLSRWRVLLTTLHLFPNNAEKIVLSCVVLHNFIMHNDIDASYTPSNYVDWQDSNGEVQDGLWRSDVRNDIPSILPSSNIHHYGGKESTEIRNNLCSFFNCP